MMNKSLKGFISGVLCAAAIILLAVPALASEQYPIKTKDLLIRDPYVLVYQGKYYMYGTGLASGRGYGVVVSEDLQHWTQKKNVFTAPSDFDGSADFWAPECHYYNGSFYLFATYRSAATGKRGTAVFKSDKPDGEFTLFSDGHVTPKEIDCIDGTLYVDEGEQPWIVYVNEWTSSPDGVGEMAAAKLSKDLSTRIGDPIVLFRANGHSWTDSNITDGPFVYKTKTGDLLLLWSNIAGTGGYAVGCARSDNGRIDGNWIQQPEAVYKMDERNTKDGGHAMLFTDLNGQLTMAIHSPNVSSEREFETARFIPMVDAGKSLEIKEIYDGRTDIGSTFRNTFLSLYYAVVSLFRRIAALFSAI